MYTYRINVCLTCLTDTISPPMALVQTHYQLTSNLTACNDLQFEEYLACNLQLVIDLITSAYMCVI